MLLFLTLVSLHLSNLAASQCVTPPNITVPQTEVRFEEGDTQTLECAAYGSPSLRYKWRMKTNFAEFSFQDLPASDRYLTINSTNGLYQCLASNQCGTAMQEFQVTIPQLGKFDPRDGSSVEADEGSSAILMCNPPMGTPHPDLYWTIVSQEDDPIPVINNDRVNTDNATGRLVFANVFRNDSNLYVCNARNSIRGTQISKVAELTVTGLQSSDIENHRPSIAVSPPEHVEGFRGEDLRLECIATGRPTPKITWTRDGTPIRSQARNDSYGLALVFDELDFSDHGIYRCTAVGNGESVSRTTNVTVKSAPYWIPATPNNVRVAPGWSGEIPCTAGGDPVPVTKWLSNGEEIQENYISPTIRVDGNNNVVVTNAGINDTRVLQCVSTNIYGQIFSNVILNTLPMPTEAGTTAPILTTTSDVSTTTTTVVTTNAISTGTTLGTDTTATVSDATSMSNSSDPQYIPSTATDTIATSTVSSSTPFPSSSSSSSLEDAMKTSEVPSSSLSSTPTKGVMTTNNVSPTSFPKMPSPTPRKDTDAKTTSKVPSTSISTMSSPTSKEKSPVPGKEKQINGGDGSVSTIIIIAVVVVVAIIVVILVIVAFFYLSKKGKSGTFSPISVENSVEGLPGEHRGSDHIGMADQCAVTAIVNIEDEKTPLTGPGTGETDLDSENGQIAENQTTDNKVEKSVGVTEKDEKQLEGRGEESKTENGGPEEVSSIPSVENDGTGTEVDATKEVETSGEEGEPSSATPPSESTLNDGTEITEE